MASKIKVHPERNIRGGPDTRNMPLPPLGVSDAAVKELTRSAKKRSYVTVDHINSVLPAKDCRADQGQSPRFSTHADLSAEHGHAIMAAAKSGGGFALT